MNIRKKKKELLQIPTKKDLYFFIKIHTTFNDSVQINST